MEILYENRYTVNKERYLEWTKHPIKKNYFNIIWLILLIFTIIMSIYSIIESDLIYTTFYLILMLFLIYRLFFRGILISSKAFHVLSSNQGSMEWDRIIQFRDDITVIDGNFTSQYQWTQVHEIKINNEYLILVFKSGMGIRLLKNAFTIGNDEDFMQFAKTNIR